MDFANLLNDEQAISNLQNLVESIVVTGSTPSGKIKVQMNGSKKIISIDLDPSIVINSSEMLKAFEQSLMVAINNAEKNAEDALVAKINESTQE
jgi:DNA-binding protein YbaB